MEEVLRAVFFAFVAVIYIILIPVIILAATPFVLLWPGKRRADGTRLRRDIRGRYERIWRLWKTIGLGLPTP